MCENNWKKKNYFSKKICFKFFSFPPKNLSEDLLQNIEKNDENARRDTVVYKPRVDESNDFPTLARYVRPNCRRFTRRGHTLGQQKFN